MSPPPSTSTTPAPAATEEAAASATPFTDSYRPAAPQWTTQYDKAVAALPTSIASRLPTSAVAAEHVSTLSDKVSTLSATGKDQLGELSRSGSKKVDQLRARATGRFSEMGEDVFANAWSVTNTSNVALNISLNQVGPLHYDVVLPNEVFERRVPGLWYSLQIRPWTSPSTAYTPWSVTWPILAVAGPTVAATSLLAIPFVAMAAGGTALASLTGWGSAAASAVTSASTSTASGAASAIGLAAKAANLPGGRKMKGKLVDAARKNVGENGEKITGHVVRYFTKATAGAAVAGAAGGVEAEHEEKGEGIGKKGKGKKIQEVDITGYDLEKALKCETGKSKVDKALKEAFEKLCIKQSHWKTKENPVLQIVGGPELEERGKHQYLVFYPFVVRKVIDIEVQASSLCSFISLHR
ncbi:hypothetical protein BCR35DRAFT_301483, partial [Leucosporidium creatinivorum]